MIFYLVNGSICICYIVFNKYIIGIKIVFIFKENWNFYGVIVNLYRCIDFYYNIVINCLCL